MAIMTRRGFLAAAAAVGLAGCNFGSLAYFLMPEQRLDAKLKHLAHADEKKKPRVVVFTHAALDLDADFLHADREIAENLARDLKALAAVYKDKMDLVPQRQVEEFKNTHPSWRSQDMTDIGKKFNADYVIYLEIHSLSMKQPKNIQLLSGNANLTIHLYDVKNPDETPMQQPFNFKYPPEERGGIPIDGDTHPTKFRQDFLERVAKKLVPYFAKYPRSELTSME
ncbi:MAG: hypothetical protein ACRC33_19300 [Gemmataceae bacterium]